MSARQQFEKLSRELMVEYAAAEERIFEMVADLFNERNALRDKVAQLEKKLEKYENGLYF